MASQHHVFSVKYVERGAGWIDIVLADVVSSISLSASYCYDPFPGMIRWLEDLIKGRVDSDWVVDEERTAARIRYIPVDAKYGKLCFTRVDGEEWQCTVLVSVRDLVAAFYRTFRSFVESTAYHPDEWEEQTFGEYLTRQLGMSEAQLRRRMARYPARALQQLRWHILPGYEMLCPEGMTEWMDICADAHTPLTAIAHDRCIAIPVYPDLPAEYDTVSQAARAGLLDAFLREVIANEGGAKLQTLRSRIIEKWLEEFCDNGA